MDPSVPHPARRYDYLLGGKDNFAADRESAREIEALMPKVRLAALENRGFLRRAVEFLSRQGIRQFLDVGTGIPTSPNTHEVAQSIDPTTRVVYVDNDPLVLAHARALLTSATGGATAYIDADLRDPRSILDHPELRGTLDLSQPVGLLLVAVLHFIRDDESPEHIVGTLVDALAPGSWVVVSHSTFDYLSPEMIPKLQAPNRDGRFRARSREEFSRLLNGLDLLEPGIQSVAQWWAEDESQPRPAVEDVAIHGAVGRVPNSGHIWWPNASV
jgi:hypothetical protein